MPQHGWIPVMVPGAVKAWPTLVKRFGKLTLKEVLAPAIRYAEEGYPVGALLGAMWERAAKQYKQIFAGKPEFSEWFKVFTKDGEPYDWNILELDSGVWHVDVNADAQSGAAELRLMTDDEMEGYVWDKRAYPACVGLYAPVEPPKNEEPPAEGEQSQEQPNGQPEPAPEPPEDPVRVEVRVPDAHQREPVRGRRRTGVLPPAAFQRGRHG